MNPKMYLYRDRLLRWRPERQGKLETGDPWGGNSESARGGSESPLFTTIGMPNGRRGGRGFSTPMMERVSRGSSDYVEFVISGRVFSRMWDAC